MLWPGGTRAMRSAPGGAEVALLWAAGQAALARERAKYWLKENPTDVFLRCERIKLGQ